MKKRVLAIITAAVLVAGLMGCGNTEPSEPAADTAEEAEEEAASPETEETAAPAEETEEASEPEEDAVPDDPASAPQEEEAETGPMTVDHWVLNNDGTAAYVPEEAQAAFDKAVEAFVGQDFEIIAYLGSQVVAGTNYMFLCRGTTVTAEPAVGLKVVIVYEDLEGKAEISKVTDFNLGEYVMVDNQGEAAEQLAGGWTVCADAPAADLPDPAGTYFEAVTGELLGADYTPLAYLGSHDSGGTSNAFLARQTLVTQEPVDSMCLVFVYTSEDSDPKLMNVFVLNLADYN